MTLSNRAIGSAVAIAQDNRKLAHENKQLAGQVERLKATVAEQEAALTRARELVLAKDATFAAIGDLVLPPEAPGEDYDDAKLVRAVERLVGELASLRASQPDPYSGEKADLANWEAMKKEYDAEGASLHTWDVDEAGAVEGAR